MTYQYTKRKIPYSKMGLSRLKDIETHILNKNPDLENRLCSYYEEEKNLMRLREEYQCIQDRIAKITSVALERKKQEYTAAGTLKKFFMDKTTPSLTEPEKDEIERLRGILIARFKRGYDSNRYRPAYETHERLLRIQRYITKKEKRETKKQERFERLITQKEKVKTKRKAEQALIAAYKGKSRRLADQVKSKLREQIAIDPHCPYCGWYMAHELHCDHIHPLSKGGLSTPQNMVYVCSDCNLKKKGLTLTQFIKKCGFSRVEIEQRLEKLGKEY
jgi:5-methylcytosine-specific restriction endonuclease McrA